MTTRSAGRVRWLVATLGWMALGSAGGLLAAGGEEAPQAPVRPPRAGEVIREARPSDDLLRSADAAAARWKMKACASRLATPGAAGQHDLLWEIAKLCGDSAKARADQDLLAMAEWLLFDAGLWREPVLSKAVAAVTGSAPRMQERLLGERLKAWISTAATGSNGGEPWLWPEYRDDQSQALGAAVKVLWRDGPRNNPMTRVWMAAALAAVDPEEGVPQLDEARKALAKHLPIYARQLDMAVASSLAGGGARACLPLLLDIAGAELTRAAQAPAGPVAAPRPGHTPTGALRGRPAAQRAFSPALLRFYGLTGWIPSLLPEVAGAEARVAEARRWLGENAARLAWDRELGRFAGGRPQPGLEELHRAATELDGELKAGCAAALAGSDGLEAAVLRAVACAEKQPAAAGAKTLKSFLLAAAETARRAHGETLCTSRWREALYVKMPALDRNLGAELWKGHIRHQLSHFSQLGPNGLAYLPARFQGVDLGVVDRARRALEPELKLALKEKELAPAELLRRHLAYLCAGGKVEDAALQKLLQAAKPAASAERQAIRLWANVLASFNETAGLRLLLLYAGVEPEMSVYCLSNFEYLAGLSEAEYDKKLEDLGPQDRAARIDRDAHWLAENGAKLSWDWSRRRFAVPGAAAEPRAGAASPRRTRPAPDGEAAGGAEPVHAEQF